MAKTHASLFDDFLKEEGVYEEEPRPSSVPRLNSWTSPPG